MEWFVLATALVNGVYVSQPIWKFYETQEDCRVAITHSVLPYLYPKIRLTCKKGYLI